MRALDQLAEMKGQFGREAAHRTIALLDRLAHTRLRNTADLIRFHENVLFLRAYPQSPRVLKRADDILFSFSGRLHGIDQEPFENPEISGIAGTGLSTNFSYEIAQSLASRYRLKIDWDSCQRPDRLGPILA